MGNCQCQKPQVQPPLEESRGLPEDDEEELPEDVVRLPRRSDRGWGPRRPSSATQPSTAPHPSASSASSSASQQRRHEHESLDWLNTMLERLWPKACKAFETEFLTTGVHELREKLPGWIEGHISFERCSLGAKPPQFSNVRVVDTPKGVRFQVHVELDLDMDVSGHCGVIPFGVSRVAFAGELTVELGPLIDEFPLVQQWNAFFVDPPMIIFKFTGAAQVAGWPGVRKGIRSVVDSIIANICVVPNTFKLVLQEPEAEEANSLGPEPLGVLRVSPRSARGLTGADWHLFGKDRSDPYLRMKLAATQRDSTIVRGTCDPDWSEGEWHDFVVYSMDQKLSVEVLDYDRITQDDYLGCIKPLPISEYSPQTKTAMPLFDSAVLLPSGSRYEQGPGRGELKLGLELLKLSPERPLQSCEHVLVMLEVKQLHLPAAVSRTLKLRMQLGGQQTSSPYRAPPLQRQQAAGRAVDEAVLGIINRGAQMRLGHKTLAEMTGLPQSVVAQILADSKSRSSGSGARREYREVVARTQKTMRVAMDVYTRLSTPFPQKDFEAEDLIIEAVDLTKKVLGSASLRLKECGRRWPTQSEWGVLEFTCAEEQDCAFTAEVRVIACGLHSAEEMAAVGDCHEPGRSFAAGGA